MTRLSVEPFIDASANVKASELSRYTEIGQPCRTSDCVIGNYSFVIRNDGGWENVAYMVLLFLIVVYMFGAFSEALHARPTGGFWT